MLAARWRIRRGIKRCKGKHLGRYYSGPGRKSNGLNEDGDGGMLRSGKTQEMF